MSNVDYHLIHHLKETTKEILVLVTCTVHKETPVSFSVEKTFHDRGRHDYETDYWLL